MVKNLRATWPGREPDLGLCRIISIDFETGHVVLSNGIVRVSTHASNLVFYGEIDFMKFIRRKISL